MLFFQPNSNYLSLKIYGNVSWSHARVNTKITHLYVICYKLQRKSLLQFTAQLSYLRKNVILHKSLLQLCLCCPSVLIWLIAIPSDDSEHVHVSVNVWKNSGWKNNQWIFYSKRKYVFFSYYLLFFITSLKNVFFMTLWC